jgi:hypothetical protein
LINGGTAYSVSKGTATDFVVGIPAEYNGKPVTQIEAYGFEYYTEMMEIVIPKGVTLDLTADDARLTLQNGAKLTVNGTVNTRGAGEHNNWNGSIYIDKSAVTINGNGTLYLKSKKRILSMWSGDGKRKLTIDGVTLVGLKDNDNTLIEVSEGSELILKSGKITNNISTKDGGGIKVHSLWKAVKFRATVALVENILAEAVWL